MAEKQRRKADAGSSICGTRNSYALTNPSSIPIHFRPNGQCSTVWVAAATSLCLAHGMAQRFRLVLAISLLVSTSGIGCGIARSHERIDSKQAHVLVQSGAKLVDVRTPAEFADKHLPGAINIPVQELEAHVKELEPKDQALILYCRSGSRSGIGYDKLKKQGFSKLHDLGAISAW